MIKLGRVSKQTLGVVIPGYWEDTIDFLDGQYVKKPTP